MKNRMILVAATCSAMLLTVAAPASAAPSGPALDRAALLTAVSGFGAVDIALSDPDTSPKSAEVLLADDKALASAALELLRDHGQRQNVNTLDDERVFTAFDTIVDSIASLESSWVERRKEFIVDLDAELEFVCHNPLTMAQISCSSL